MDIHTSSAPALHPPSVPRNPLQLAPRSLRIKIQCCWRLSCQHAVTLAGIWLWCHGTPKCTPCSHNHSRSCPIVALVHTSDRYIPATHPATPRTCSFFLVKVPQCSSYLTELWIAGATEIKTSEEGSLENPNQNCKCYAVHWGLQIKDIDIKSSTQLKLWCPFCVWQWQTVDQI